MATSCNLKIASLTEPSLCEKVVSGVRRLLYVPRMDVERIGALAAQVVEEFEEFITVGSATMGTQAVVLKPGCEFAEIACSRDLGELKYTVQGSAVGNRSFHVTLEIHHTGFKRRILAFFALAANLDFVLLCQLANGQWHLIGDLDRGAQIADGSEATSGKAASDQNGATLTFEHDTPMPRVMYEGWSPDDSEVGVEMYHVALLLSDNEGWVLADNDGVPFEFSWK